MKYFTSFIPFLFACGGENTKSSEVPPPAEMDWGSWELRVDFQGQSETCADIGASGENLGTLYGEVEEQDSPLLSMSLGDMFLEGELNSEGFSIDGYRSVPAENEEGYGIRANIEADLDGEHSFSGQLVYDLNFMTGSCEIRINIEGAWLYYEPPPPCTS